MLRWTRLAIATTLLGATVERCFGDHVTLEHGGSVRGTVVRDASLPRSVIAVQSPWGAIQLDRGQVSRILPQSPAQAEYARRAPTVSDTADAQFALARWCRDNGLSDELKTHLRRVLLLDPDHEEARALLGYQRINGQWWTREELLASRGLVRHDGEFRTRQEIALLEKRAERDRVAREWKDRLERWRRDLGDRDAATVRAAARSFDDLNDPAASAALVELLVAEREPRVQLLLIDAAARLNTPNALGALVRVALECPDPEARATALEHLDASGKLGLASPFVAALRSKDNVRINLAGDALAVLGDGESLSPLVDALVTTHTARLGADSPGDTFSFNAANGQFAFGGGGPQVVKGDVPNPRVLRALVELTGVNHLYDKQRWRAWLALQEVNEAVDLRRDP